TGHSLGAGVSAILAMHLKLMFRNRNIQAWNFATPPCCTLKTLQLERDQNFIINFVNEKDIVLRLSL
ncbi:15455_t:CDS:1, partial [Gigaspora margarita]